MVRTFLITIEEVDRPTNKIKDRKKKLSQKIRGEVLRILKDNKISLTAFGKGCKMSRQAAHQLLLSNGRLTSLSVKKLLPGLSAVGIEADSSTTDVLKALLDDYAILMD